MLHLTLVLNDKNYIFRHEFYKICSKLKFHENTNEILAYV